MCCQDSVLLAGYPKPFNCIIVNGVNGGAVAISLFFRGCRRHLLHFKLLVQKSSIKLLAILNNRCSLVTIKFWPRGGSIRRRCLQRRFLTCCFVVPWRTQRPQLLSIRIRCLKKNVFFAFMCLLLVYHTAVNRHELLCLKIITRSKVHIRKSCVFTQLVWCVSTASAVPPNKSVQIIFKQAVFLKLLF
jgi:hypothetical protein